MGSVGNFLKAEGAPANHMLACMHGLIRSMPILLRPLQRACGAVGCFRYITTLRLVPETLSWGVTKKVSADFEPASSRVLLCGCAR